MPFNEQSPSSAGNHRSSSVVTIGGFLVLLVVSVTILGAGYLSSPRFVTNPEVVIIVTTESNLIFPTATARPTDRPTRRPTEPNTPFPTFDPSNASPGVYLVEDETAVPNEHPTVPLCIDVTRDSSRDQLCEVRSA